MTDATMELTLANRIQARASEIATIEAYENARRTDRMLAGLLAFQWVVAIVLAFTVSPYTWIGVAKSTHEHVWAAIVLGGLLSIFPIVLAFRAPGAAHTRHTLAVAQMLWSALLIHLSGGRIETHFHVFGSLAVLSFYRDWKIMVTATIVVAADHFVRGVWWPQSVFGVLSGSSWRWVEHATWVIFMDFFLVRACLVNVAVLGQLAHEQADAEIARDNVEEVVRRRTAELRIAKNRAETASRSKTDFLANMSHEIRTPMTAILGFADLLATESGAVDPKDAVRTIQNNGQHLLALINDILDLSKIEANKMEFDPSEFNPADALEEVRELLEVRAKEKGLELKFSADDNLPTGCTADATRLRQVLINLVGNAIKFTEQGSVRVEARFADDEEQDGDLTVDVVDTGCGLGPDEQVVVFKPFTQADSSTTRKFGGTGLGLSISQRLCEGMGGELNLVESAIGVGSRFRMTIPLADCSYNLKAAAPKSRPAKTTTEFSRRLNILVAEDGPDNQRLLKFFVERAGGSVTIVENGELALDAAWIARTANRPFDVILMDMQMPVMDGYTATSELRRLGYDGPIIAVTAHAMPHDVSRCLEAGCDDYVAKPLDRLLLLGKIQIHADSPPLSNPADPLQTF